MEEFAKIRGTLWQNDNYCSEDHFPLVCQISCDSNSVIQMISISTFLPCTISGAFKSPRKPCHPVLCHFYYLTLKKLCKFKSKESKIKEVITWFLLFLSKGKPIHLRNQHVIHDYDKKMELNVRKPLLI